jgi:rubrerythrin
MKDDEEGESPENKEKEAKLKATKEVLSKLTAREAKVLRDRFGISLESNATLEEIGKQFDITRARIREIEKKALKKLRQKNEQIKTVYVCSFCGKRDTEVKKMVTSESKTSSICDECITECYNLIRE